MRFFEELKRRNVIRVGAAYVVGAWLIVQVVETLFPIYELPPSAIRFVVTAIAVGFIPAVLIAWAFEVTPDGLKWEKDVDRSRSIAGETGKTLDRIIIVVLAAAVGFFAFDKFVMSESREAEIAEAAREAALAETRRANFFQSIAVLPFVNRSDRDDDVYFVDGIHDDILTQLARIQALAVTSRTSVEQYRGTTQTIRAIAEELDVRTILEGGVQRAGDRVRINVQLIDATNDDHLWAETYVRELTAANIFAVQADIAASVAKALAATLMPSEESALAEIPTESMAAYDYYLLGRHHWRLRTKESIELARDYFLQAIEQDPDYVPALSGLADSYVLLVDYGTMRGQDAFPLAQEAIDRALSLDDASSEVWASQGLTYQAQSQYGPAGPALEKALELDPKNSQAWSWYSINLRRNGRLTEAFEAAQKAYELEPMSVPINWRMIRHYGEYGDFARLRQHLERIGQADEGRRAHISVEIASAYLNGGDLALAIEAYRAALATNPTDLRALAGIGAAYIVLGDIGEADRWYSEGAAQTPLTRVHYRLHYARGDFAGAIALHENILDLRAPYRPAQIVFELFNAHYLAGDIDGARAYLTELMDIFQGRVEIPSWRLEQLEPLNIASFWLNHGDEASEEPQRGMALAEEIRNHYLRQYGDGFRHPTMLAHFAATESLLGNLDQGFEYLNAAIDKGYRNTDVELEQRAFDPLRNDPRFAEVSERLAGLAAQEKSRLARIELAPYTPPKKPEPVAVARATLEKYSGYYTDGNALLRYYLTDDGRIMGTLAQDPPDQLFMLSDTEIFTPLYPNQVGEFVMDENGVVTHHLWKSGVGSTLWKKIPDLPPAVQLSRDVLAKMEGTYAHDKLGGIDTERTEADTWVAVIYVDDDGKLWVDFDDQPKLELEAVSESELRIIGYNAFMKFTFDPDTGVASSYVSEGDFGPILFVRQDPETLE